MDVLTLPEVAGELGIPVRQVRRLIQTRRLKAVRISARVQRVSREELRRFLAGEGPKGPKGSR